jgi:tetratricopeptide (TPR) repeat protein
MYHSAIQYFKQASTTYTTVFTDAKHLYFARIHMQMGGIYLLKLKPRRALQLFETALAIYRSRYGDEHLHIASCYQAMSYAYSQLKHHRKCSEYIMKGYEMHEHFKPGPNIGYLPINHTLTGAEDPWYSPSPHNLPNTPSIPDKDISILSKERQITTTDIINDIEDEMDDSWKIPREPFMTLKILYCETEDHHIVEIPLETDRSIIYRCPRCKEYVSLSPILCVFKGIRCRYCIRRMICCCS